MAWPAQTACASRTLPPSSWPWTLTPRSSTSRTPAQPGYAVSFGSSDPWSDGRTAPARPVRVACGVRLVKGNPPPSAGGGRPKARGNRSSPRSWPSGPPKADLDCAPAPVEACPPLSLGRTRSEIPMHGGEGRGRMVSQPYSSPAAGLARPLGALVHRCVPHSAHPPAAPRLRGRLRCPVGRQGHLGHRFAPTVPERTPRTAPAAGRTRTRVDGVTGNPAAPQVADRHAPERHRSGRVHDRCTPGITACGTGRRPRPG